MEGASLRLSRVGCERGGRTLFAGLDLALGPGGAALVTGPNGAGKSSLLRIMAGLLRPIEGQATQAGAVALADERPALDEDLPLARAVGFWAGLAGGDAAAALNALGLAHLADVPVRYLSAGQKRRGGLARVVASRADVWLLDEPGNGLDTAALGLLEQAIVGHRAGGGIVVVASHQPIALPDALAVAL